MLIFLMNVKHFNLFLMYLDFGSFLLASLHIKKKKIEM